MKSSQTELERIRWHTVEMDDGLLSLSAARGGQAPLTARQARAGHGSDEGGLWTPRSLFGAVYVGTARHGVPSTAMSRRHGGAERSGSPSPGAYAKDLTLSAWRSTRGRSDPFLFPLIR